MEFDLDRAREVLERTPNVLSALLGGLSEEWVLSNEGQDSFSPRDVLGHLVSGEKTDWVVRTETILVHGPERSFEPFDRFSFREDYEDYSLGELVDLFRELRERNLERIRDLGIGPEQLSLKGRHPELGDVTLRQLLATWVAHDLSHIRQIARVMAKQYRDEVGPWERYLRVMSE